MNSCVLCDSLLDEKLTFCDLLTLTKPKARACDTCFEKFQRISGQHCPKCYRDGASEVCMDCQVWIEKGKEVCHKSCFVYNEAMKDLFSQYKFQGGKDTATVLLLRSCFLVDCVWRSSPT